MRTRLLFSTREQLSKKERMMSWHLLKTAHIPGSWQHKCFMVNLIPQNEAKGAPEDTFTAEKAQELPRTKSARGSKMGTDEQEIQYRSSGSFWKAVIRILSDQKQYLSICIVLLICCVIGGMLFLDRFNLSSLLTERRNVPNAGLPLRQGHKCISTDRA